MLVLSRQRDESIMIGDNIVVTIVDIRGDKVRLGINAPDRHPRAPPGNLRGDPARERPRQPRGTQRHARLGQPRRPAQEPRSGALKSSPRRNNRPPAHSVCRSGPASAHRLCRLLNRPLFCPLLHAGRASWQRPTPQVPATSL